MEVSVISVQILGESPMEEIKGFDDMEAMSSPSKSLGESPMEEFEELVTWRQFHLRRQNSSENLRWRSFRDLTTHVVIHIC